MNNVSLLSPPIAIVVMMLAVCCLSWGMSRLSFRRSKRVTDAYACGEDVQNHMIQPDYAQFLPFAFFFTILHVMALMATTVPVGTIGSFAIAIGYVVLALTGLFVLYSR
jgi:hypothetical protein